MKRPSLLLAFAFGLAVAVPGGNLLAQDEEVSTTEQFDFSAAAQFEEEPEPAPVEFTPSASPVEPGTEGANVEISVEELTRMAGLSPNRVGKEYEEDLNNPTTLFGDPERVARMLGVKPKFIYFPQGADPMIIPWVRDEIIAQELLDEVALARKAKDFEKARTILNEIVEKYGQTEVAKKVPEVREAVRREEARGATIPEDVPTGPDEEDKYRLPRWIEDNTNGVIIADEPLLIVGTDWLKVGDTVPGYGSVRVKSIAPSEVLYVYQDKEYAIPVVGSF